MRPRPRRHHCLGRAHPPPARGARPRHRDADRHRAGRRARGRRRRPQPADRRRRQAPGGPRRPGRARRPGPTIVPATSGTLADFFKEKNVAMEPQKAADFKALNIVLPMPTGWTQVPDPNVPDAFAVIADRVGGDGLYTSNAAVQVYKLVGDFDPKEAISHGLIDSQQLPAWRATDGSLADFGGMPSSLIEGTYRQNNMTLNTSRRHVIATSGPDRYLVSLSVTTSAQVSVAAGSATDAIVNGFRVGSPDAPPARRAAPRVPRARRRPPDPPRCPRPPSRSACRASPRPRPAGGPRIVRLMLIAAVLCLCAAVATAATGLWSLARPHVRRPRRAGSAGRRPDPARRRGDAGRGWRRSRSRPRRRPACWRWWSASSAPSAPWPPAATRAPRRWPCARPPRRRDAGCAGACASCTLSCH